MTDRKQYLRDQRRWIKSVKLKVGDTVAIIAKAESGQAGWNDSWMECMVAPSTGTIMHTGNSCGIMVKNANGTWYYPFYILIKQ